MRIVARFALSLDGFSAAADGRPAILAAPDFDHGKTSHGIPEFNAGCEAVAVARPRRPRRAGPVRRRRPLAQDPRACRDLKLEAHRTYGDGTVELSYSPA